MSKEQASEFLKKVSADKTAAEKFKEAFRAALLKAGKEAGFKFTREELDAALTEMKAEITEGEVKGIAAAGSCMPGPPCFPGKCSPDACQPQKCQPVCFPSHCYPNGN